MILQRNHGANLSDCRFSYEILYIYNKNKSYISLIKINKLTAIHADGFIVVFFKSGLKHNIRNAASAFCRYKEFYLNDKHYGFETKFTKKSWRKFVKLKVFL